MTFMWYANDMFHMFKAEFVALVSLKVPSGKVKNDESAYSARILKK